MSEVDNKEGNRLGDRDSGGMGRGLGSNDDEITRAGAGERPGERIWELFSSVLKRNRVCVCVG